ncbi:MAG: kinase, partial [Kordiimonadaceae bacterium]|nr:kinase [Kordiimonadaceae bacterium]
MISTPSHIQKPYAVVIGGANMDIYGSANEDIRLKDSNPGRVTTSPGGVARNIAENLAKLEVSCHLIAAVGNDLYGDKIIQHAKTAGINVEHILRVGDANTSTYLSVLDNDNDTMVAISDMDIVDHLTPKKLKSHDKLIKQAAVIVADTNLSEEALHYLSDRCFGQPLFVDTVSAAKACRIKPFLKSVHTLKTNRLEAETISAMPASKNDN